MAHSKMFLVENDLVIIRDVVDGANVEVGFSNKTDFYKYCQLEDYSINIDTVEYLDYEPERSMYFKKESNGEIEDLSEYIPVNVFDILIGDVATIKANFDDKYFGATLEEAKTIKIEQAAMESGGVIYTKWPLYKQNNLALGNITGYDSTMKTDLVNDINIIVGECNTHETNINALTDVASIKAYSLTYSTI